jgi:hypothetical protein
MKDAADLKSKAKARRADRINKNKGYKDPDRVNYKSEAAYEKHEANESPEEDAAERKAAKMAK